MPKAMPLAGPNHSTGRILCRRRHLEQWREPSLHGGGDGNDVIDYSHTTDWVEIWGDDRDNLKSGNDTIIGGSGADEIHAGKLDDDITGGKGADELWGGSGADFFNYHTGDSPANFDHSDTIHDFNAFNGKTAWDQLDLGIPVDKEMFGVSCSHANLNAHETFDLAKSIASHAVAASSTQMIEFVTDGHDGWLFADTYLFDKGFEYAIKLDGVTDLSHMNFFH